MQLRNPNQREQVQLKVLWKICFGDTHEYIDRYFNQIFDPCNMLVCVEPQQQQVCAMLSLLPVTLQTKTTQYKGRYVYGVATLPSYRNQGWMTKLFAYAQKYCRQMGEQFLALVPANESLFSMYEKLGFETQFYLKKFVQVARQNQYMLPTKLMATSEKYFNQMRTNYFNQFSCGLFLRGAGLKQYLFQDLTTFGNEIITIENKLGYGYIACRKQGSQLMIREVGMKEEVFQGAITALGMHFGVQSMEVSSALDWHEDHGMRTPYGMIQWLTTEVFSLEGEKYMNLMLD